MDLLAIKAKAERLRRGTRHGATIELCDLVIGLTLEQVLPHSTFKVSRVQDCPVCAARREVQRRRVKRFRERR